MDLETLSEDERWGLITDLIKQGKGPRRGRPRKDGSTITWKDVGFTRMQVYYWRLLAKIPYFEQVSMEVIAERSRQGRGASRRAYLVRAGLVKNVSDENVFEGTELGELARELLKPARRILADLPERQARWLLRALRVELRRLL